MTTCSPPIAILNRVSCMLMAHLSPPFEASFYRYLILSTPYADVFKRHVEDIFAHFSPDGMYFDFIRAFNCVNPHSMRMMEECGLDPANPRDREELVSGMPTVMSWSWHNWHAVIILTCQ